MLNTNLKRVLDFIIEVALEGITKFYVSQKNESPYLSEILKLDKNQISDYIVQHMFTKIDGDKTHKIDQFDFNDLNKKFDYDTWFLTPGYIRELAYDLHIFNNNQPEKTEGHN